MSDPGGTIAMPYAVIDAATAPAEILRIAAEHEATQIVVGHPRSLSGASGPAAKAAEALAETLRSLGAHVTLWDERLTSVEADRALIATGAKRRTRRADTDRIAATIMLQSYLDAHANRS